MIHKRRIFTVWSFTGRSLTSALHQCHSEEGACTLSGMCPRQGKGFEAGCKPVHCSFIEKVLCPKNVRCTEHCSTRQLISIPEQVCKTHLSLTNMAPGVFQGPAHTSHLSLTVPAHRNSCFCSTYYSSTYSSAFLFALGIFLSCGPVSSPDLSQVIFTFLSLLFNAVLGIAKYLLSHNLIIT